MPKLVRRTKNLIIRLPEKKDFDAWKEFYLERDPVKNDFDLGPYKEKSVTKNFFNQFLKRNEKNMKNDEAYTFFVFEKKTGKLVGRLNLMNIVRSLSQSCFLGYSLNNRFWGRGYGKESVAALIDIAFRDVRLHRVEAGIEPQNRRSIMLARSLGLRKEGLKKRAVFLRQEWRDLVIYSGTCEEFGFKWSGSNLSHRL